MAGFPVVWTEPAIVQREETLRYWTVRNKSPAYAKKLLNRIEDILGIISENPEAYRERKIGKHLTREAIFDGFSLFYTVRNNIVVVITFWSQRDDPDKLERLLSEEQ